MSILSTGCVCVWGPGGVTIVCSKFVLRHQVEGVNRSVPEPRNRRRIAKGVRSSDVFFAYRGTGSSTSSGTRYAPPHGTLPLDIVRRSVEAFIFVLVSYFLNLLLLKHATELDWRKTWPPWWIKDPRHRYRHRWRWQAGHPSRAGVLSERNMEPSVFRARASER